MDIAGYTSNANKDDRTVSLAKHILAEHGRVMTDFIRSGDKYPNIDGFLEMLGERCKTPNL